MDLFWRENLICPTEPEYIEMVNNSKRTSRPFSIDCRRLAKLLNLTETGGLFRIAIKLMMAASPEIPLRYVLSSFAHDSHATK